jgi:hypothetical protein
LQTINITALQGAAKPFKDTVTVPLSLPADSVFYGFSTALYWNDGTKSAMLGGQRDACFNEGHGQALKRHCHLGQIPGRRHNAAVYLDNVSLIDTGKVDSIAVWYGLRDSVEFFGRYRPRRGFR